MFAQNLTNICNTFPYAYRTFVEKSYENSKQVSALKALLRPQQSSGHYGRALRSRKYRVSCLGIILFYLGVFEHYVFSSFYCHLIKFWLPVNMLPYYVETVLIFNTNNCISASTHRITAKLAHIDERVYKDKDFTTLCAFFCLGLDLIRDESLNFKTFHTKMWMQRTGGAPTPC